MKLSTAQLSYLGAAARRPLLFTEITSGPSIKCANSLVSLGLLRRHTGEFRITRSGRAALKGTTHAE